MTALASQGQLRASIVRWSLFTVPACVLFGFLSGRLAGSGPGNPWFDALEKPSIFPDPMWFGIVWTALYILIGIALALVCAAWGARGRTGAIASFLVLAGMLLAWSPLFFALHQMTLALILLGAIVVATLVTTVLFWRVRSFAGMLMLPLLGWVCFATLLNYEFLRLNPALDGAEPTQAVQRFEI
ncbi:tryptophan-rich sensory protein [Leptolyngbya sp. 15MV]|nr:tryptophan-rich sensory protein [Leptolyngbya sp. 15MV]